MVVGMLTLSASDMLSLVVTERCTVFDLSGSDDDCPPTCVTCGCCARAVEPALLVVAASSDVPSGAMPVPPVGLPRIDPRDILHVPKPRLA